MIPSCIDQLGNITEIPHRNVHVFNSDDFVTFLIFVWWLLLQVETDISFLGSSVVEPDILAVEWFSISTDEQFGSTMITIEQTECSIGCGSVVELDGIDGSVEIIHPVGLEDLIIVVFGLASVHSNTDGLGEVAIV